MRDGEVAIEATWKRFRRFGPPTDGGDIRRESWSRRRLGRGEWWWALSDITASVEPGAGLAVLGRNGSGKSTLMKLAAGFLFPTYGSVRVGGRVASIVEITTGTAPDLSGRENVFLLGAVNGRSRAEMSARFDDIIDFAGLGDVVDRPLGFYSSGMRARLAFSTITSIEPDVLIVDEALSVGDADFKERSADRIRDLRRTGCTLLFVSHDLTSVLQLCTEGIRLDDGVITDRGDIDAVAARYEQSFAGDISAVPGSPVEIRCVRPEAIAAPDGATQVTIVLDVETDRAVDVVLDAGVATSGLLLLQAEDTVSLSAGRSEVTIVFEPLPLLGGRCMTWVGATAAGTGDAFVRWQRSGAVELPGPGAPPRRATGPRPVPLKTAFELSVSRRD